MYSGSVRWFGQIFFVGPASFGIWCCIGYAGLKIVLLYCMHATIFVLGFGLSLFLGALGLSLICSPKQKRCPTSTFKVSNFIERKTFFSLSAPLCWWVAFLPPNCWPPPPLNVWMTVTSAKSFGPQTSTNTFTAKSPSTDWYWVSITQLLAIFPATKIFVSIHPPLLTLERIRG